MMEKNSSSIVVLSSKLILVFKPEWAMSDFQCFGAESCRPEGYIFTIIELR